eukprot:6480016-Amphidinium_carterae.3
MQTSGNTVSSDKMLQATLKSEVGIQVVDRIGCDKKEAVLSFLKQNPSISPMHMSADANEAIEVTSGGNSFYCSLHGQQCAFGVAEQRGHAAD